MLFYHMYREDEVLTDDLRRGSSRSTMSGWASRGGGNLYPEIIQELQRGSSDEWMDFHKSFAVYPRPYNFAQYLQFPLETDNVYVFNREIVTHLFGYIEEEMTIGSDEYRPRMFTDDLPPKETLMKAYWQSRTPLETYIRNQPYPNPEYLCFFPVPAQLLRGFFHGERVVL
ncbi:hypothetical protein ACE1TF_03290 [Geomicrobium sp. JSM 1781026]|uniref:hypothetical protein n=1 Tax=Geomicrobium sp. JSM 1781026 TaxID=3344580 RepID=UPI0035C17F8D